MAAKARESDKLRIFISYSRRDTHLADGLVEALTGHGFEVAIDRSDLPFGEKWQTELAELIRLSDTVIWLVSAASIASKWVNWELDEVAKRSKRLVPVMIAETPRDALPRQLGEIHILPAEGAFVLTRDLQALLGVLETDRGWLKQASRLQDRATEWLSQGRQPARLLSRGALADAERWKDMRPVKAPAPPEDVLELLLASRRAVTRRQRWFMAGSAAVALMALALAGLALWQRVIAEDYAAVSQEGVDDMVFNVVRVVRDQRGMSTAVVQQLLGTAERVVDKMVAASQDPQGWKHRQVAILAEFADVYEIQGDNRRQRELAQKSLDVARELAANDPNHRGSRRSIWVGLGKVGDAYHAGGDTETALRYWRQALPIARALSTEEPSHTRYQRDLTVTYNSIGNIELALGNHAEALQNFRTGLAIRKDLAATDRSNLDLQRELALSHTNVGNALLAKSDLRGALQSYESALALTRQIANSAPDNLDAKYRLSVSLERLGLAFAQRDRPFDAENAYLECSDLRQSLTQADPLNMEWRRACRPTVDGK